MAAKATASYMDTITSSKWSLSTGGVVERNQRMLNVTQTYVKFAALSQPEEKMFSATLNASPNNNNDWKSSYCNQSIAGHYFQLMKDHLCVSFS